MPNVGSWNGKWTGENNLYVIIKKLGRSKKAIQRVKELSELGSCYYNFGDGWGASVSIKAVDAKDAAKFRRASKGFCAYDWMVDTILEFGKILNDEQAKRQRAMDKEGVTEQDIAETTPELVS